MSNPGRPLAHLVQTDIYISWWSKLNMWMPIAKPQNITIDNDIMYPAAICKHNLSFFLSFLSIIWQVLCLFIQYVVNKVSIYIEVSEVKTRTKKRNKA